MIMIWGLWMLYGILTFVYWFSLFNKIMNRQRLTPDQLLALMLLALCKMVVLLAIFKMYPSVR